MKSVKEIQELTSKAINDKIEALRRSDQLKKEMLKKERKQDIESAKENATKWFPEWIEEAAKKGKNTFDIDVATYKDGKLSFREKMVIKYIKKYLKDFKPVFEDVNRIGTIYNYDGEPIGENHYTAVNVKFTW